MQRCLSLAAQGLGNVAPNPMVGCVIVHGGRIIGEGYHNRYGGPHAEVNAIHSVRNRSLLESSTLYVSLEPCVHHGKTPPCTDLILTEKIGHVVVGTVDPFSEVAGKGIEKLRQNCVKTEVGILEKECRQQNRRFFTFHEKKRPYIILKWAQSLDGFMGGGCNTAEHGERQWITNRLSRQYVHKCRTQEAAILIGARTALADNPLLTAREWSGNQPLRIIIDQRGNLPAHLHIFDGKTSTLVFSPTQKENRQNLEFVKTDFEGKNFISHILKYLHQHNIQSVVVEGGAATLNSFIGEGLWDEAHIYYGNVFLSGGIEAPNLEGKMIAKENFEDDRLVVLTNENL
ncbi:MAG: bifunctional diaminohydroxyphosphoribosylaminopyrimidine deaminase/5-amino-6-(5-phosphoribosylamino)uracil reductase RibD [Prolixibacteraceae bacterium]|nr:bifunctional diaminohydroxyphosphoribosylaminopyrimidine deaminase/5-amino-6-(5-phosphoribosylamino)uracil reductase RibD [Prolixibacteraceae bacterium]